MPHRSFTLFIWDWKKHVQGDLEVDRFLMNQRRLASRWVCMSVSFIPANERGRHANSGRNFALGVGQLTSSIGVVSILKVGVSKIWLVAL